MFAFQNTAISENKDIEMNESPYFMNSQYAKIKKGGKMSVYMWS